MNKIEVLTRIANHFKNENMYNKICRFTSFSDNMFTYNVANYEITLIAEDVMLARMELNELLNLNRLEYFDVKSYGKEPYSATYNSKDEINQN